MEQAVVVVGESTGGVDTFAVPQKEKRETSQTSLEDRMESEANMRRRRYSSMVILAPLTVTFSGTAREVMPV